MVKLWIGNVVPLLEPETLEYYYHQLPEHRKKKADKQKVPIKKAQSVGAWVLWCKVKGQYSLTEEDIYSLSHSGDYVICSAIVSGEGNGQLGCDIQQMVDYNRELPRRIFTPLEWKRVKQESTKEQQKEIFYRLWVLKESFQKATRQGMKLDMRSFEIVLGNPTVLTKQPQEFTRKYYCYEIERAKAELEGYKVAVCTTETEMENILHEYSFKDESLCSHTMLFS